MKNIKFWLAVIVFLFCAPAFADNTNDPFNEVVANYLAANPKPSLPEEARKYRVQAEAVQEKQFDKAVELYGKALEIAPWWPQGHFNRAIILGELKKYREAMREMKRYLQLIPDAPDARAAQDRIYQWEVIASLELPEEVRKLKMQAEGAVRNHKFEEAAELYGKVLDIAPEWTVGHYNRAIVLAEIHEYSTAITEMKRYLTLVPDAPDARAAQDKIYEWERKAGK